MRPVVIALVSALLAACSSGSAPSTTTTTSGGGGATTATTTAGAGGTSTTSTTDASPATWRSALYPADWTPAHTDPSGAFLHDFSYAGYHQGADPPGAPASLPVLDAVAGFGADPSGQTDATAAIQAALDAAAAKGGAVVHLPAGLYRCDGTLAVHASRIVLRGDGPTATRLHFTKVTGMDYASHLRFEGQGANDLELPLVTDAASRGLEVEVASAAGLAPGDDVALGWVITPEFVEEHGMTGVWQAFNGTWQPFFRRTVVAVDTSVTPARITFDVPLRYPAKIRDQASLRRETGLLREVGIESLGVANAVGWDDAWSVTQSHALELAYVADGWIRDVASFPSPLAPASGPGQGAHLQSGGILVRASKRVTVADTTLGLAENRGGGGNGYLFEIRASSEVLFRDSVGEDGRHNFIQNWGFGVTGCVWLRVQSRGGVNMQSKDDTFGATALSELHHSLATANLIDASVFDDGFSIVNRQDESTGAGHTGTENALWNLSGKGMVRSLQFGTGYLIGTRGLFAVTESPLPMGAGTAPTDWVEGLDQGATLSPASLYEDQLARRLAK